MKAVLFYFVQFTWGFIQNFVGFIGFLIKHKKCAHERFGYSIITYAPGNYGGVSMGIFIFMNPDRPDGWKHDTQIHEYGHTWQSLLLGPLYFLVIGLPSAIWCDFPVFKNYRQEKNVSYYWLYCEGWANLWGLMSTNRAFIEDKMLATAYFGKPLPQKYLKYGKI